MRCIVKTFRRPPTGHLDDRTGGFPRPSDSVAPALRYPASPRRTLLAENLGKPSLGVIISDLWYSMRVVIVAVGRWKKSPERALFEHYAGRLKSPLDLIEVEEKKPLPTPKRMAREADLLRAAVPKGAVLVALDGGGRGLGSREFADRLAGWRDDGVGDVAFVIGGADGFDPTIRNGADLILALGPQTWPHLLVRGLLAEQLYRAECIAAGHPYHRE